jgi:lysophospholipase L1-like esterase
MRRYLLFVLAAFMFACSPVRKYRNIPEVLAWENDIQKFEQLDKSEKYPENAVLFAGSSSIRLWETLGRDMAPYSVIQRGFGGSKLSDLAIYADRIFSHHSCQAIVIFVANDITGSDKDKSPDEVAKLFGNVLKTIRKSHPATPVFWIEVTPTQSRWEVWPVIQKESALIKDMCSKNKNIYFISTSSAFLDDKGLPKPELFREDKLHLTPEGYAVWTEIIKKDLDKVLQK